MTATQLAPPAAGAASPGLDRDTIAALLATPIDPLPGPYASDPGPDGPQPSAAVMQLVRGQVRALLESSHSFRALPPQERRTIAHNLTKIAAYSAALVHDEFAQAKKLGQQPILRRRTEVPAGSDNRQLAPPGVPAGTYNALAAAEQAGIPPSRAGLAAAQAGPAPAPGPAADEFSPRAANNVARITGETLNAIAFPTFVADLIKGTFNAIVDASIQQMEAFAQLLANVAKTVDQFMADNITDNQARDYLAAQYPGHFRIEIEENAARIKVREGADDLPAPNFKTDLGITQDVSLDDDAAEEALVPAARRKLASSRHELLSTMVLMGINRIVVTSGRIRATMGFRIATEDRGTAQSASQFDWKNTTAVAGGFLGFGAVSVNSVAYVSSSKKESSDEIDVQANLTGEVDLKFKSDVFPLERFADAGVITTIQGNTPNPSGNAPNTGGGGGGGGSAAGGGGGQ
ncbi:MAG TPA: hypothetical protein VF715_11425 [Thermoleophilaceae bacterium]|jgi:hypothetical protein